MVRRVAQNVEGRGGVNDVPIIIPMPMPARQRDCITVEGRVYCHDDDLALRDVGVALLITAVVLLYCGVLIYQATYKERDWVAVIGFLALLVVPGLWLVLR